MLIRLCGCAGWSAPYVVRKRQCQGTLLQGPYDIEAQVPGYAPGLCSSQTQCLDKDED